MDFGSYHNLSCLLSNYNSHFEKKCLLEVEIPKLQTFKVKTNFLLKLSLGSLYCVVY